MLLAGGVLLGVLGTQLAVIYLIYRVRQAYRAARGLAPVDTSPKVDPLTWGRLTRRGRVSTDPQEWTPVGNPDRFLRRRDRTSPPSTDHRPPTSTGSDDRDRT